MNKAYLLTGGNTGDRKHYLKQAIDLIEESCGKIRKQSALYETEAWGKNDQPSFLNQALLLHTSMNAPELMQQLLAVEEKMGRRRGEKYGPRIIDIDVLLYNDAILESSIITVPHPEMANRRFALTPLAEIAAGIMHPLLKKSIRELLKVCPDQLAVRIIS